MATNRNRRAWQCAFLGSFLAACSGNAAHAGESEAAKELREARQALGRWSEMKAEQFEDATQRLLRATEARLTELRNRAANSELADDTRDAIAKLETESEALGERLVELKDATGDQLQKARKAVVDAAEAAADRVEKAWKALTDG
ncbi:MAG: hypothetical protein ACE37K_14560 [Planctomycetota bacterium]